MERRLLRGIMNPAMVATWVFGLALALTPGSWTGAPTTGSTSSSRRCWG